MPRLLTAELQKFAIPMPHHLGFACVPGAGIGRGTIDGWPHQNVPFWPN